MSIEQLVGQQFISNIHSAYINHPVKMASSRIYTDSILQVSFTGHSGKALLVLKLLNMRFTLIRINKAQLEQAHLDYLLCSCTLFNTILYNCNMISTYQHHHLGWLWQLCLHQLGIAPEHSVKYHSWELFHLTPYHCHPQ